MKKVRREEKMLWIDILGAKQREVGKADSRKIERVRWCRLEGRIRCTAEKVWFEGS